jgi:hypothetical protein
VVPTEVLATHNLKLSLDHPAHLDLQDLLDIMEMLGLQELLATLEDPDLKALLANLVHLAILEKKEHQATMELPEHLVNLATTEKREPLVTMEHLVYLEALDFPAKTVTMELPDLQDLKVKLAHQVTLSHPRSQAHQVHLATRAKTELLVTLVVPDPLAQLALLDFKELLANRAPMVILEVPDLRETLELLVMLEPQAKMDTPAHLARSLVHLVPLDLLDPLATMALLARMVSLAALDTQAKMESPELLDTLVKLTTQIIFVNVFKFKFIIS